MADVKLQSTDPAGRAHIAKQEHDYDCRRRRDERHENRPSATDLLSYRRCCMLLLLVLSSRDRQASTETRLHSSMHTHDKWTTRRPGSER
ncbi:hypothetical protein DOTSEDRAFT_74081 [Dothistroma septosporum NZE10]|uniref:Uncharacterized protein n=1 Tax=Dothistroma septosporum (strain NZE10 / CBS 128990) TaxID=675120 RepID=N1PH09_DOTSN|nr:hypothetical protein DOTSEDRAFT_74081 [Dothistroma septosporum NZE10]